MDKTDHPATAISTAACIAGNEGPILSGSGNVIFECCQIYQHYACLETPG